MSSGHPDLLRVPTCEGEVLKRGADGVLLLGALQAGWHRHTAQNQSEHLYQGSETDLLYGNNILNTHM